MSSRVAALHSCSGSMEKASSLAFDLEDLEMVDGSHRDILALGTDREGMHQEVLVDLEDDKQIVYVANLLEGVQEGKKNPNISVVAGASSEEGAGIAQNVVHRPLQHYRVSNISPNTCDKHARGRTAYSRYWSL